MTKRGAYSLTIVLVLASPLSCQERLVDEQTEELWKICTAVTSARVYDEQGNPVRMVHGPTGGNSLVCLCLTIDETLSGDYDEYFNDKTLEVCLQDATRLGYPEANDCAYWYEDGLWVRTIGGYPYEDDVRCEVPTSSGCSVQ